MLEKIEGKRRRGWRRMSWLDSITDSMDMNHSKFREIVKNRQAWLTTDHRIAEIQPWLSDWTTATQTPDATFFSIFSHGWFLRWGFQPFWWIIQLSCVSPVCVCACYVISVMANSLEPCSVACQASLSMGFSRQEYWNGLPFPSPMHACMLSRSSCDQLCVTLWTVVHQAPRSMGFSRQEYWSGLPFLLL